MEIDIYAVVTLTKWNNLSNLFRDCARGAAPEEQAALEAAIFWGGNGLYRRPEMDPACDPDPVYYFA